MTLKQERVFKNRFGTMIYEDILHFKNSKEMQNITEDEIIFKSQQIAVAMLKEKKPEEKNKESLKEAIEFASKVKKSEVAYA